MISTTNCVANASGGALRAYAMPESPKPIPVKVESETRPNFMKLKEIERKRREILLRVSLL